MTADGPALLPNLGVQLQASSFFERLTSREQLQTFGSLCGVSRSAAVDMLELVGLTDKADVQENNLSGGRRQRLSIACALAHDPEIVDKGRIMAMGPPAWPARELDAQTQVIVEHGAVTAEVARTLPTWWTTASPSSSRPTTRASRSRRWGSSAR